MKKLIACCIVVLGCSLHSFAQNPVVEKAIKDPKRKVAEAKADVFVADSSKRVINTTQHGNVIAARAKKISPTTAAKKKRCVATKRNKKSSW